VPLGGNKRPRSQPLARGKRSNRMHREDNGPKDFPKLNDPKKAGTKSKTRQKTFLRRKAKGRKRCETRGSPKKRTAMNQKRVKDGHPSLY